MKLLILGGTVFLGRHLVWAALERGHEVTIFTRGVSAPQGSLEKVEHLVGDRDGRLDALRGRSWDAVIDTSGYVPRVVGQAVDLLKDAVGHYTFISTISVYADLTKPNYDESAPVLELEDPTSEDVHRDYGSLKALCERVVEAAYPGRSLIIRPGLIVGPYDITDRFTYWPARVAKGGQVLAPGDPERPVQFIDARDLAAWTIRMTEAKETGVYNATGPASRLTMGELLAACKEVSGSDAEFVWVPESFLKAHGVGQWMELPLWISEYGPTGMLQANIQKALAHGLAFRDVRETIADTLAWDRTRPSDYERRAGLKPEREQALLAEFLASLRA
jgi:2'-hydroxyisoflavone reductase